MVSRLSPSAPQFATVDNLDRPSLVRRPPLDRHPDLLWALLAHWSFSHGSVATHDAITGLLDLYDWADTEASRRRRRGIQRVRWEPAELLRRGAVRRGAHVTIDVADGHFADDGDLALFGLVLSEFLSLYATINAFVHLTIETVPSGRTMTWTPDRGAAPPGMSRAAPTPTRVPPRHPARGGAAARPDATLAAAGGGGAIATGSSRPSGCWRRPAAGRTRSAGRRPGRGGPGRPGPGQRVPRLRRAGTSGRRLRPASRSRSRSASAGSTASTRRCRAPSTSTSRRARTGRGRSGRFSTCSATGRTPSCGAPGPGTGPRCGRGPSAGATSTRTARRP